MRIGLGNLNKIAKRAIVFDFQILNPCLSLFGALKIGDPVLIFASERTKTIQLVPDRNDLSHEPSFILRGLKALHLRLAPAAD